MARFILVPGGTGTLEYQVLDSSKSLGIMACRWSAGGRGELRRQSVVRRRGLYACRIISHSRRPDPLTLASIEHHGGISMGWLLWLTWDFVSPVGWLWDISCLSLSIRASTAFLGLRILPPADDHAEPSKWSRRHCTRVAAGRLRSIFFTDHLYELLHSTVPASFGMDAAPYRRGWLTCSKKKKSNTNCRGWESSLPLTRTQASCLYKSEESEL